MTRQSILKKKLPDTAGVYFFLGTGRKILYIGRATSLRSRVRSYFDGRLLESRGPWLAKMLPLVRAIDFRKTDSLLEAIFLEADLIKKFQPPYNTDEKDDKSFNCVVITKEDFPAVFIARSRNVDFDSLELRASGLELRVAYGPFTNGFQLQTAMKLVRRIFPYRDLKCTPPVEVKLPRGRGSLTSTAPRKPCFNRQIGLCPGTCTGEISKAEYAKTIRNLRLFFEGKKTRLINLLRREMKEAAKAQAFEGANELKKTVFALQHIQDIALLRASNFELRASERGFRVEAYDLSHFGGKEIVGAMAVVEEGRALPSEYRLFKIRGIKQAHETKGYREMLRRRFNHPEWPFPNLIVVDGNEAQKSAAETALRELHQTIPVVAVTKDEKHRPFCILGEIPSDSYSFVGSDSRTFVLLANSEAHRFALKFQKKRRDKTWLTS